MDVLPGTGQWLLSDPVFDKWKKESVSSILWLHGIPGSGKSKLA
jgi:adenylylsulfate kinase-like enzyme